MRCRGFKVFAVFQNKMLYDLRNVCIPTVLLVKASLPLGNLGTLIERSIRNSGQSVVGTTIATTLNRSRLSLVETSLLW